MTISKTFVHFGLPGCYEGVAFPLTDLESYLAMFEAFRVCSEARHRG